MTPCGLVNHFSFRRTCNLLFYHENGGSSFTWNVTNSQPDYTVKPLSTFILGPEENGYGEVRMRYESATRDIGPQKFNSASKKRMQPGMVDRGFTVQGNLLENSNLHRHYSMNLKSETAAWNTLYWLVFLLCISHIHLTKLFSVQSIIYNINEYLCFMFTDHISHFFRDPVFSCLQDLVSYLYSKHMTGLYHGRLGVQEQAAEQNIWI
jgi:hypothetical protein